MVNAAFALEPTRLVESTVSTNLRIVFSSRRKLEELSRNVLAEFRSDILRLAGTDLANTSAATVDSFCNAWVKAQERFKTRSSALATYKAELANAVGYFQREHADELRTELKELVGKCDDELQQRSEVADKIMSQRSVLERWLKELDDYDDTYKATATTQKKKKSTKK